MQPVALCDNHLVSPVAQLGAVPGFDWVAALAWGRVQGQGSNPYVSAIRAASALVVLNTRFHCLLG
jgi:hypothetical protein